MWTLAFAYWLHMAATVVWIGGLTFQSLLLYPSLRASLGAEEQPRFMRAMRKRFQPIAWLSLATLIGTGLIQMSASPSYEGLLAIGNLWSAAILIKHLLFGLMVLVAAYQTWVLQPALEREALRAARQAAYDKTAGLRRERRLVFLNTLLALLVLALTALARAA